MRAVVDARHGQGHRDRRSPGILVRFVAAYGWRAYALPVLIVVTLVALRPVHGHPARQSADQTGSAARSSAGAPSASSPTTSAPLLVVTDSTACLGNTAARRVIVSIKYQKAWMCQRQRQVNSSSVTTGASAHDMATPTGSWTVQGKQRNLYLTGPGYRDYVHYWIPFDGEIGFHDASWQSMPFGSGGYRTQGSHGCVHLPGPVVSWLYQWAGIGSTVVTVLS